MAYSHRAHSSVRRRSKKPNEDVSVANKPGTEELRRLRTMYFGHAPNARRVASSSKTATPTTRSSTGKSQNTSAEQKSKDSKQPTRNSTVINAGAEKGKSFSRRRTEDYVYGTSPSQYTDQRPSAQHNTSRRPRRSSESTASESSSLSTVSEDDIEPGDSVSQSGRHSRRRQPSRPPLAAKQPSTQSVPASTTTSRKPPRPTSFLGSLLRRNTTTSVPTLPRTVECLTCGSDDVPITRSAKLECGHRMCHECLKRIFDMSVKDPAHMPPKCCTDRHIPLKHVERLFDLKFKRLWNRKYQEYHTKDRLYCPAARCGEWIKPTHVRSAQGRRFAVCPRCRTRVCVLCQAKLHKTTECPKDPAIAALVRQAQAEGWQTCYSCRAIVERKEGCNHMTCRCQAQFCIVCGRRWKTCECPWFDYTGAVPDGDRLQDMRVPEHVRVVYRRAVGRAADPEPVVAGAVRDAGDGGDGGGGGGFNALMPPPPLPTPAQGPPPARPQPTRTYTDELDHRQRQERQDADLARRMQFMTFLDPAEEDAPVQRRDQDQRWGLW